MRPSQNIYDFIKSFEGFNLKAYPDPGTGGKPWTIGYGSTQYDNGQLVQPGDMISKERAEDLLEWEIDRKAASVNTLISGVTISQNKFDALVSLAYNIGVGALRNSTLLKKVKANPVDPQIETQFLRWNRAGGRVLAGLTRRRKAEAQLYFT